VDAEIFGQGSTHTSGRKYYAAAEFSFNFIAPLPGSRIAFCVDSTLAAGAAVDDVGG
jgi:hypothetical protein